MGLVLVLSCCALAQQAAVTCTFTGVVTDGLTGQAVARAQVEVLPQRERGAATDAEGRWVMGDLPCTDMRLLFTRRGYLGSFSSARPDSVLKVTLQPRAQISGRVLDEAGEPLEGATVQVYETVVREGRWVTTPSLKLYADLNGNWRAELSPGRYGFCARTGRSAFPPGGGTAMKYSEQCLPGPMFAQAPATMRLTPGQRATTDFNLRPGSGAHVRGTVTGAPANGWAVVHLGVPGPDGSITEPVATAMAEAGDFDLAGISAGHYLLEASAVDGDVGFSALQGIEIGGGDVNGITLGLAARATLSGTMRFESKNAGSTETVFGDVSLRPVTPGGSTGPIVWDEAKRAFSISHIVPGTYRIVIRGGRFHVRSMTLAGRSVDREITVRGDVGPLDVQLDDEAGAVEGTVTDGSGKPRAAQLLIVDGNGTQVGSSGADGKFSLPGLATGRLTIWVVTDTNAAAWAEPEWSREHAAASAQVDVVAGGVAKVGLVWADAPPL